MRSAILTCLLIVAWKSEIAVLGFPAAATVNANLSDLGTLIVGGVECARNELPYQISVRVQNNHFCGGVILNKDYILTTAHCARRYSTSFLSIYAGEHRLDTPEATEQIINVDRVIIHPSYSPTTLQDDIALLRLRYSLSFNNAVQPISLAPDGSTASGMALVSGWGATTENGPISNVLRKVTVPIVSDASCRLKYFPTIIYDSMICAGERGRDSCQGDSGGPLVTGTSSSRLLVGLVSWGIGCGRESYPGVYTEISYYRNWIAQNSKDPYEQ